VHERRVVSALFADMVGSTWAAESADPEDVQARMTVFHQLLKRQIESFGGTVEKFAGDAVMAVFGAPIAHEDDAERAVRAGLAIVAALAEQSVVRGSEPTHVRVGVATGEVMVDLGASPEAGQAFVTGDVVNTAARVEAAAPVDAVVVGEATFQATSRVFDYAELDPVLAPGKADPVKVWRAGAARARLGVDVIRTLTTPLVGRQTDLGLLRGSFDKVVSERTPQLVTIVGEPGVGKSRLVAELGAHVERSAQLVTWRQGRCLPYGEGVTFWALGEIVKAHLGIFDADSTQIVADKLDRQLPDLEDRAWVRARLLPLVGVESEDPAGRVESFTAWRRLLESMAEARPTVLVFEDLHWADEALLAFLEHLADWAQGVPLLVLGTARPELFDAHPAWGAGLRHATTISLSPLSDQETAELVEGLLDRVVLPAATSEAILARAGGNPLFAEEFVRMLNDRGLVGANVASSRTDMSVPDSIQALLAARLDTLPPEHKALVQNAAVIGKVFWAGALVAMGGDDPGDVRGMLHELTRKELVRPARASSMAGEAELGFWHVLIRDVAYGQLPRAERAAKHVAFARWLAERAGLRVEDLAEVLAHHTVTALDLALAVGDQVLADQLRPDARRYAAIAGDRAIGMDTQSAIRLFERALALTDAGDPGYPRLLFRFAVAMADSGRYRDSADTLRRALALYEERNDVYGQAAVVAHLSEVVFELGEVGDTRYEEQAVALLRALPPGGHLVEALLRLADGHYYRCDYTRSIALVQEALELHEVVDDPGPSGWPVESMLLGLRAQAQFQLGDAGALAVLEDSLAWELSKGGYGRGTQLLWQRISGFRHQVYGPAAGLATLAEAHADAERHGLDAQSSAFPVLVQSFRLQTGRLDEVAEVLTATLPELMAKGEALRSALARSLLALALTEMGRAEEAFEAARPALQLARDIDEPETLVLACTATAAAELARGDAASARDLLMELTALLGRTGIANSQSYPAMLPRLVRAALGVGDVELAARLIRPVQPNLPLREHVLATCDALLAEGRGDLSRAADVFADAAGRWEVFGHSFEQAYALLGLGRCRATLHDPGFADALRDAREVFSRLGAGPRVAECDSFLSQIG
jgi:class 3 adenylate cyclase/tetratricopeptide (TPR) repeat protein